MLRVTRNEDKENATKFRGCRCNTNQTKIPRSVQLMPSTIVSSTLKPDSLNPNGRRYYERACECVPRERSKSSNASAQKENMVHNSANNKRRSSVTTMTEVDSFDHSSYMQRTVIPKGLSERCKEDSSYNYMLKQEIRGILEDKQYASRNTNLSQSNIRKPVIHVNYSECTINRTSQRPKVFSSTIASVVPGKQVGRHQQTQVLSMTSVAPERQTRTYSQLPRCSTDSITPKSRVFSSTMASVASGKYTGTNSQVSRCSYDNSTLKPQMFSSTIASVTAGRQHETYSQLSASSIGSSTLKPHEFTSTIASRKQTGTNSQVSKYSIDNRALKPQMFSSTMASVTSETKLGTHSQLPRCYVDNRTLKAQVTHYTNTSAAAGNQIGTQSQLSRCTINNTQKLHALSSTMASVAPEKQTKNYYSQSCTTYAKSQNSNITKIYEDKIEDSQSSYRQRNVQYEPGVKQKNFEYPKKYMEVPQHHNATVGGPKTLRDEISPIPPNIFTNKNTLISKNPDALREPKLKKREKRYACQMLNGPFVGDIYSEEYLHDIIKYIKTQELKITLKDKFLLQHNPDYRCRAKIVNWVLKEQANINFSEGEYYLAVNLFDHVLATIHVPINMYQLVIISSLWIAMKLIGSCFYKASVFVNMCEGAYLTKQVIKMEQKILKIMNCKIHTTEPTICLNYYLKFFKLQDNYLAKLSAYYILDCFSLTPEFSSTPVSVLAAASIKYTLTKYHEREQGQLNIIFAKLVSREDMDKIKSVEALIYLQLMNMADENYTLKEPYYKYGKKKTALKVENTINI